MVYTVGEAAKILNVPPSTIRYYDKEGLLPFVERSNGGIRMFRDKDFEWFFIIECLKKTGMPIKDIKKFIDMSVEGDSTINKRLELVLNQRNTILKQLEDLQNTLDYLNYKCWYYQTAKDAGTTSALSNISMDDIPEELRPIKENLDKMFKEN